MQEYFNHILHQFDLPLKNPVLVFSLILFIILLSPILLKKLNIPGIIGLIIAGVIIGPHGFHILEKNSAVTLFSTIGLLYIMFIAGLELDMNEFKVNKHKSILFGIFTFVTPILIGFPTCYYLLGYGFDASFLTASMFATHTLVAYPIVSKLGVSKNQSVAVAVGGTILTDTAVLIILAVIIGKSKGSLNQEFWIRLGISLSIFTAIMFLIIPRIAKWFFSKLESEKHSHYIFVLSVVFFAAFLAEVAGVEPIIGAFVAGLALNKLIPHTSALMNRIEFIGNSLFVPFFLISVGMIVNVQVILNGPMALIIAGTLSIVALCGKWIAAWLTQISFRYSTAQRQIIFGLSSAHAAATLAVILVGYEANIIDENILNGTIILILITCIVASFVTEKAAKKLILETNESSSVYSLADGSESEHILFPVADVSNIEKILEFIIFIKDKNSVNPISILSVVTNDEEAEKNSQIARNQLEKFVLQASASETKVSIITAVDHNVASGISRISREIMADIVVLGWPQRTGFIDRIIGKKVDSILNSIDKTIFVCQVVTPFVRLKKIVVAVPSFAEHEKGFSLWILKLSKLSQELSIPLFFYCDENTKQATNNIIKLLKIGTQISFEYFNEWDDFLILSRSVSDNDLFVLVSAKRGATSYTSHLDSLPLKLEKHFANNSKIIIYPQEFNNNINIEQFNDFSSEPLSKGIETVQKIGKEIGSIFKISSED
ncbi:MAG: cation:proton antiporter [Chitinophagaceae bacterium]|nr:cation:proton antiporter [Chitinophagaceae bacterium]